MTTRQTSKEIDMKHQVIFSGSFRYVAKRLDEMSDLGYKVTKSKKWDDGKWTYVMEKEIRR